MSEALLDVHRRWDAVADIDTHGESVESMATGEIHAIVVADSDSRQQAQQLGRREGRWAAAGLSAQKAQSLSEAELSDELQKLERELSDGGFCAVGDIGLDFRAASDEGARRRQRRAFAAQLQLAERAGLAVIVEVVEAYNSLICLLRNQGSPRAGGVVHDYDGSPRQIGPILMLDFDISFGPSLGGNDASRVRASVDQVPGDRLLIESGLSHSRCEEADRRLLSIAEEIAELRGDDVQRLCRITAQNGRRRFEL